MIEKGQLEDASTLAAHVVVHLLMCSQASLLLTHRHAGMTQQLSMNQDESQYSHSETVCKTSTQSYDSIACMAQQHGSCHTHLILLQAES